MSISRILAAALFTVSCGMVEAASISVTEGDTASGDVISFGLVPGDAFDTIILAVEAPEGGQLLNYSESGLAGFFPLVEGDDASFFNALIGFPAPSGLGFSVLDSGSSAATGLFKTAGSLGSTAISDSPLFLGQVVVPEGASGDYSAIFVQGGDEVGRVEGTYGFVIPEPTTALLAGLALVGFAARRK